MNYATLCTNIQEVCENTFEANQLAMFVQQAEQKIFHSAQLPAARKSATSALTISNPYFTCPADFLAAHSLAITVSSSSVFLLEKDVNFIREAYPNPATTGVPKHYAIFGPDTVVESTMRLIVGPTPALGYVTELHYFAYPESIVTADTTWLGDNFDSVLLNGALIEALRFMKGEPDMVALYEKLYVQAMGLLKNLGDGKLRQDSYRSGQYRVKPQ
jgi:hypothetical protein